MSRKINKNDQLALFESIINFSDDAIITKTLDGVITSWNNAAGTLFGFTDTEIIGKHISLIIPKDRVSEELEIISKIKAGQYVKHYETERLRKDGSTVFISLTVSPIKNKKRYCYWRVKNSTRYYQAKTRGTSFTTVGISNYQYD